LRTSDRRTTNPDEPPLARSDVEIHLGRAAMVAFVNVDVVTLLVVALIQADGPAAAAHLPAVAAADHVALHGTSGIRGVLEVLILVDKISS
jgi:hypothetical protein